MITQSGLFFIPVAVFFPGCSPRLVHPEYIPTQVGWSAPGSAEVSQSVFPAGCSLAGFSGGRGFFLPGSRADLQRALACPALPRIASLATLPPGSSPQNYSGAVWFLCSPAVGTRCFWVCSVACSACSELVLLVPLPRGSDISGFCGGDNRAAQTFPALSPSPGGRWAEAVLVWSDTDHGAESVPGVCVFRVCRQELCPVPQGYLWCWEEPLCLWGCGGGTVAGLQSTTCGVYCCWRR